jgi:hypothetical protein
MPGGAHELRLCALKSLVKTNMHNQVYACHPLILALCSTASRLWIVYIVAVWQKRHKRRVKMDFRFRGNDGGKNKDINKWDSSGRSSYSC